MPEEERQLREIFTQTTRAIHDGVGSTAYRPKRAVNAAVVDSLMTGVAKRLSRRGRIIDLGALRAQWHALMANPDYMTATETGTSQEANVRQRLTPAERAFAEIQ